MKWSHTGEGANRLLWLAFVLALGLALPNQTQAKPRPSVKKVSLDQIKLDADDTDQKPAAPRVETLSDAMRLTLAGAEMLEKERDYQGVAAKLKPKLDQLPRQGLLQLARAQKALGNTLGEIQALELVTSKNPKDYVVLTLAGDAYLRARRFEDSAHAFESAKTLNNRYRPAYDGLWTLLEQTKEIYEARTLVQDIVKIFGPDAKSTAALCRMYSGGDFLEKAVETCRQAISINPRNPDNYVQLTLSLRDSDAKAEAANAIADAAKRFPASEPVQNLAGEMKASDKSFADAYRFYSQSIKANPFSAKAQLGFAQSAFELQKHDEAVQAFTRACKLDRKTMLEFRQAALQLKRNQDPKWSKYQDAIDNHCD